MRSLKILLVFLLTILPSASFSYEKELGRFTHSVAYWLNKESAKRVAVADFTDLRENVTELGRFIAEEVSTGLIEINSTGLIIFQQANVTHPPGKKRFFDVVDRGHIKSLIREHKLSMTGMIDPETAKRVGKISGVDTLVVGTITSFGDSVRIQSKLLNLETAVAAGAIRIDIPKTKTIEELLGRSVAGIPTISDPSPPSGAIIKPLSKQPDKDEYWKGPRKAIVTMRNGDKVPLSKISIGPNSMYMNLMISGGHSQMPLSDMLSFKVGEKTDNRGFKAVVTRWDGKSMGCEFDWGLHSIQGQSDFGSWHGLLGRDIIQIDFLHVAK